MSNVSMSNLLTAVNDRTDVSHTHPVGAIQNLQSDLDDMAPLSHTHTAASFTDMHTTLMDRADLGHMHYSAHFTGLTSNLDEKATLVHNHPVADVTGLQTALDAKAPSNHTHTFPQVTGLQSALDTKAPSNHTHTIADVTGLQSALDTKAPLSHTHAIANVTGLQSNLDYKAPQSHTHTIAHVTGLQSNLDYKAPLSHTHTIANVTGLQASLSNLSNDLSVWRANGSNYYGTMCNVGIATSNPTLQLHVVGNASASSFSLNFNDYMNATTPWYGMTRNGSDATLQVMGYVGFRFDTSLANVAAIDQYGGLSNQNGMFNAMYAGDFTHGMNWQGISHGNHSNNPNGYALLQSTDAQTLVNSIAGRTLVFASYGVAHSAFDGNGCLDIVEGWDTNASDYGYVNNVGQFGYVSPAASIPTRYSVRTNNRIVAPEFNAISDVRAKDEVKEFGSDLCLSIVEQLEVRHYKFKQDNKYKVGVVAQEVEKVFPNCVSRIVKDEMQDFRVVDYNQLLSLLIGAVQELSRRLEEIEAKRSFR